jgi:stearoyl-CoA desaturase (delta-9 desaturase)
MANHGVIMGLNLPMVKAFIRNQNLRFNWFNVIAVSMVSFIGLVIAPIYMIIQGVSWGHVIIFGITYWLTGFGITMGYHRLFAHKAFNAHPLVQIGLACLGAMAFQNSVFHWASDHRRHHNFVDTEKDPYNAKMGFWWSHILWIFFTPIIDEKEEVKFTNIKDLLRNPILRWQHKHNFLIGVICNIIVCLATGYFFGDYLAAFLIVGFLRMAMIHHSTFFINSFAHMFGRSTHTEEHTAKDSFICSLLALGEGYHNYHHTFPNDYRNGIKSYNFDPTKWIIWTFSKVGMTWDLKRST